MHNILYNIKFNVMYDVMCSIEYHTHLISSLTFERTLICGKPSLSIVAATSSTADTKVAGSLHTFNKIIKE